MSKIIALLVLCSVFLTFPVSVNADPDTTDASATVQVEQGDDVVVDDEALDDELDDEDLDEWDEDEELEDLEE